MSYGANCLLAKLHLQWGVIFCYINIFCLFPSSFHNLINVSHLAEQQLQPANKNLLLQWCTSIVWSSRLQLQVTGAIQIIITYPSLPRPWKRPCFNHNSTTQKFDRNCTCPRPPKQNPYKVLKCFIYLVRLTWAVWETAAFFLQLYD